MWIRSQDKEILIKASSFRICEFCEHGKVGVQYSIDGECANGDTYELGVYSTKEKAIKVLDMIQKRIYKINENQLNACGMYRMEFGFCLGAEYVLQMPRDSEVE